MLQSNGSSTWPAPQSGWTGGDSVGRQSLWSRLSSKLDFALVALVVATSPMNFLRLDLFYFTLSDLLALACFGLMLRRGKISFQPIGRASTFYWLLGLTLLLAGLIVSSILHGDPLRGIVYAAQYFFAYFVLLLVIAGRTERELIILAKIYVLVVAAMCLHGAYLINIDGQRGTDFVSGNGRLTGFVERENECAAVIAFATPLLLFLVVDRKFNRLLLLLLPLFLYGVMLTGSNTGLGAFVLSVIIFSVLTMSWKRLLALAAIVTIAIVSMMNWGRDYLPALFQQRVLEALEQGDFAQAGTFDRRVELIHEAISWANTTVFAGMGADQFALTSVAEQPVHNLYLLLWTEGGLLCMLGFIMMITAGYGRAILALRIRQGTAVATCSISIITIFLLTVNAFPSVYGRFWSMPLILAMALTSAFVRRNAATTGLGHPREQGRQDVGRWLEGNAQSQHRPPAKPI